MTAATNVQENIFFSSTPGSLLHRNHLCSQKWLIFSGFYYELCGVYLFIIFPNCTHMNESLKSSGGHAIPLPYILQLHKILAQGVTGTYPGHPTGRWALPPQTPGQAGQRSLPGLTGCPCSPCSNSCQIHTRHSTHSHSLARVRLTPGVSWARKLLCFSST